MNPRKSTAARRLVPVVILLFLCAGAGIVILHRSKDFQQPVATPGGVTNQNVLFVPGTNDPRSSAVTNQWGAADEGDRVVALISEGNQLLSQGNYAGAAHKYEQAVAISPDQEDLHYNLAIALAKLGKTEDAKKQYEEALRIFPDYAEAQNNLGNLLMSENKLEEAIVQFRKAIGNMPENASFHNNLGTAFARRAKLEEAITEFEQAIKYAPAFVEARANLANALLAKGRVDEAIVQLNEALRLRPDFKPAIQAMQRARQRQEGR